MLWSQGVSWGGVGLWALGLEGEQVLRMHRELICMDEVGPGSCLWGSCKRVGRWAVFAEGDYLADIPLAYFWEDPPP